MKSSKQNSNIHVLYLSRTASYQELSYSENREDTTLVMGFFDNVNEVFQRNGKGGDEIDHLSAFGIHASAEFAEQKLTAKQLFTLVEFQKPLRCHFNSYNPKDGEGEASYQAEHFGSRIIRKERLYNISHFPAFTGIICANLNKFEDVEKTFDDRLGEIASSLERIISKSRTANIIPDKVGEISRNAEVRLFKCTNCSDFCVTVSTIRLMDILLVSKAVQACIGERAKSQFSPVWSFVTIPTMAFRDPALHNGSEEDKKAFAAYIDNVNSANSFREKPFDYGDDERKYKEAITVDFRLSFEEFGREKQFLDVIRDASEFEQDMKRIVTESEDDRETKQHQVDHIYRVAGVLGNGNYSVHLPFHDYLELFRYKYMNKDSRVEGEHFKKRQKLLEFLLDGVKNKNPNTPNDMVISYQRIRFCYTKHLYYNTKNEMSPFAKALNDEFGEQFWDISQEDTEESTSGLKRRDDLEMQVHLLLRELSEYRNCIMTNESRFREAIYLVKDLVYTYNDLLVRNNLHTTIFLTQIYALLSDCIYLCKRYSENEYDVEGNEYLIKFVTENLRMSCLALDRYSHEIVMNAGNNFNSATYEIQSKVNIEKYVVAYSGFLQKICDDYMLQYHSSSDTVFPRLYPFVYLDLNKKRISIYPFFERLKYENPEQHLYLPVMLGIAVPNYRRFSNAFRMLPQLVHEISHHFIYTEDHSKENLFLIKKGALYSSTILAHELCHSLMLEMKDKPMKHQIEEFRKILNKKIYEKLEEHISQYIKEEKLKPVYKKLLKEEIINPYILQYMDIPPEKNHYYEGIEPLLKVTRDIGEFIELLKTLMKLCSDGNTEEQLGASFCNLLCAIDSKEKEKIEEAEKDFWEKIIEKKPQSTVLQGIENCRNVMQIAPDNEVIIDKKLILYILYQIYSDGLIVLLKENQDFLNQISKDAWVCNSILDIYREDSVHNLYDAYNKIPEQIKKLEGFATIRDQYKAYTELLEFVPDGDILVLRQSTSKDQTLNKQIVTGWNEAATEYYKIHNDALATKLKNVMPTKTKERVTNFLGFIGHMKFSNAWYEYTKIHDEISSDIGMCAAFQFDGFGYIAYFTNLYIDHIDDENDTDSQLEVNTYVRDKFRYRRYWEVICAISGNTTENKKAYSMLVDKTRKMMKVICRVIGENNAEDSLINKILKLEDMILEKDKENVCQCMEVLQSQCSNDKEWSLIDILNNTERILHALNGIGLSFRRLQTELEKKDDIEESEKKGERTKKEKITFFINQLSDYLRYVRVVRKISDFVIQCETYDTNIGSNVNEGDFTYGNLYLEIRKSNWVKELEKVKICEEIGNFYNGFCDAFKISYSFCDQVDFILHYYMESHRRYEPLHKHLKDWKPKENYDLGNSLGEVEEWLKRFFDIN